MKLDRIPRRGRLGAIEPIYMIATPRQVQAQPDLVGQPGLVDPSTGTYHAWSVTPQRVVSPVSGDCSSCDLLAQATAMPMQVANGGGAVAPSTASAPASGSKHESLWIGLGILALWHFSKSKRER